MNTTEVLLNNILEILKGGKNYGFPVGTFDADTSTTRDSGALDGAKFISVQINAAGLDQADGVLKLQGSNDKDKWKDLGISVTLGSGTSNELLEVTNFASRFLRADWAKGTNAAGTIELILHAKN